MNPLSLLGSSKSRFGKLTTGYYLNIDDKAVLVCWACDTGSGDEIGHGEVTFVLGENRECDNIKWQPSTSMVDDGIGRWCFPQRKKTHWV